MTDTYAGMPYRPALVATLRLYLAALVEYDAPSLVHCVAGKDRTGFAVAIVHRLLGVHEDDLMHDYLLTNTSGKLEERSEARRVGNEWVSQCRSRWSPST